MEIDLHSTPWSPHAHRSTWTTIKHLNGDEDGDVDEELLSSMVVKWRDDREARSLESPSPPSPSLSSKLEREGVEEWLGE